MVDVATNTVQVTEGGRVMAKVSEDPFIEKEARLMYDGMTGVLSSSLPLEEVQVTEIKPGVCGYTFSLPLNNDGLTLAWTMNDDKQEGEEYFDVFSCIKQLMQLPSLITEESM